MTAGEVALVVAVLALYGALALVLFAANHYGRTLSAWYHRRPVDLDALDGCGRVDCNADHGCRS